MSMRYRARAIIALVAAYAIVLQAVLLAVSASGSVAGAGAFAAVPICSGATSSPGHGRSVPTDHGHGQDCLDACLTGCCCGTAIFLAPGSALVYAPLSMQTIAANVAVPAPWRMSVDSAHRPRAPPLV